MSDKHPMQGLSSERDNDPVNHPSHYNSHPSGVEAITITEHMNFNIGNAMKYLWRTEHKDGIQDIKKAVWYLNREIDRLERLNENQVEMKFGWGEPTNGGFYRSAELSTLEGVTTHES